MSKLQHEMKEAKIILILMIAALLLFYLMGCNTVSAPNSVPQSTPVKTETMSMMTVESGAPSLAAITDLAGKSSCAAYSWKNRGHAPKGYIKGMALVYARAVCNQQRSDVLLVSNPAYGLDTKDALAHYDIKTEDELLSTYALLIGLGMRESSGNYCCGRDMSAHFEKADSAEAGLFQTSWGAHVVSPELSILYSHYEKSGKDCLLDVFKEGASCSKGDAKTWGTGTGAEWQQLTKRCPAFAAEYGAVLVRLHGGTKGEFGPLIHKAAEYKPECLDMLTKVKKLISSNPDLCRGL